jgi:cardiolipin synthase
MTDAHVDLAPEPELTLGRTLADQAFSRASGAPLVPGNSVRILKDAAENYPAWLEAIATARRTIHFESYIIHEDQAGHRFAEALAAKAREGVPVRLLYDWLGALGHASRGFWRGLRLAGVEVRCFNPPRLDSPFGWLSRDHRKMIAVDGRVGFVTGLCVGQRWVGDPARGIEPWRDTGVEVRGPAVADLERAFAETWALCGAPIPSGELPTRESITPAGDVMLRVIASAPTTAELYRLDQLIAAGARRSLWLTDAYFVGGTPYVRALCAAARDGVDIRLLVPGASDVWLMRALSRASYRPLLESGIRVFEWNGPMLHAKSAVADGRWARVGSTNLNVASWIGNWELDVAVEDAGFARAMEEMYVEDLRHVTEIVLTARHQVRPVAPPASGAARHESHGSAGRVAAGALGMGRAVGAAVTGHRVLGPAEAKLMASAGIALLVVAALAAWWPWLVAVPLAAVGGWLAVALLLRAWRLHREIKDEASPGRAGPNSERHSDRTAGDAGG